MKGKITLLFLIAAVTVMTAFASSGFSPVGKWSFTAVGAPPEYEKGVFEITNENERYQVYIVFEGSDYKIPCEKVVYDGDKLTFSLYLDVDEIRIALKFDGEDKLTGDAETPEGFIALQLVRLKSDK